MERLLIVNADDFGLSKGQNYGIIEACRNGIVTSTTALVNGQAIDHAVQLSRDEPSLAIGMHFVLTMGKPLTAMPGLTRDGVLGKWIWQLAEEDALPLEEITQELASQYLRFIELFGRKPTHLDSHHHVHMFPQIFPIVARFAAEEGIALRADRQMVFDLPVNLRTTQGRDLIHIYAGILSILGMRDHTRCAAISVNSSSIKLPSALSASTIPSSP